MSKLLQPRLVPSDVISRWPAMALSLWKRSFRQQAIILLATALAIRVFPSWSTLVAFLVAPSLFVVAVAAVQIADEKTTFSWWDLIDMVLPGALRLVQLSVQFAAGFGALAGILAWIASALVRDSAVAAQQAAFADAMTAPSAAAQGIPDNLVAEFLLFCATWAHGVMAMVFLGMFIVAIYQGVFGTILHAQEGLGTRESRLYGWQAWQVNSASIEQALREAPPSCWLRLTIGIAAVACAFQSVYFSPVGLILATYVPCLAYVAYRSIFLGKHENVPAALREAPAPWGLTAPAVERLTR